MTNDKVATQHAGQAGSGEQVRFPTFPYHKSADPFERAHFIVATVGGRVVCFTDCESDADFIVEACNSHASLSAEKEALVKALTEVRYALGTIRHAVCRGCAPPIITVCDSALERSAAALLPDRKGP
jgi:hypothetical protein